MTTTDRLIDKIIAEYKAHYAFPWQGESSMRDVLADELAAAQPSDRDLCIAVMTRCVERLGAGFMSELFNPSFNTDWVARFKSLLEPAPDSLFTEARAMLAAASDEQGESLHERP